VLDEEIKPINQIEEEFKKICDNFPREIMKAYIERIYECIT